MILGYQIHLQRIDHLGSSSVLAGEVVGLIIIVVSILKWHLYLVDRLATFLRQGKVQRGREVKKNIYTRRI